MDNKIQVIKHDIITWFSGNRKGNKQSLPCFWTLYPLSSISQTPNKGTPYRCENYEHTDLETSVEFLMEQMRSSRTTKFFGVRLREGEKKVGITNNFMNPYYENLSNQSISGLSPTNGSHVFNNDMIGVLREMFAEKEKVATNQAAQEIAKIRAEMSAQLEMIKIQQQHKDEVKELKNEIAGLRHGAEDFSLAQMFKELQPTIGEVIKYKLIGGAPSQLYDESGEPAADSETYPPQNDLLEESLALMKKGKIREPEELIFKIATVIKNSPGDQVKTFISMVQSNYNNVIEQLKNEPQ